MYHIHYLHFRDQETGFWVSDAQFANCHIIEYLQNLKCNLESSHSRICALYYYAMTTLNTEEQQQPSLTGQIQVTMIKDLNLLCFSPPWAKLRPVYEYWILPESHCKLQANGQTMLSLQMSRHNFYFYQHNFSGLYTINLSTHTCNAISGTLTCTMLFILPKNTLFSMLHLSFKILMNYQHLEIPNFSSSYHVLSMLTAYNPYCY
jgi:hypothetical protein